MISRKLLQLITLTSLLPLAACATPDADPQGADVSPLNAVSPEEAPLNNASLNASIDNALNANSNSGNANGNNNLLANEMDNESMDEGDEDFDDENLNNENLANNENLGNNENENGNLLANDEGADLEDFDNNAASEEFLNNTANAAAANTPAATAVAANAALAPAENEAINSFKSETGSQNAFASNNTGDISSNNLAASNAPAPAVNSAAAVNAAAAAKAPVVEAPKPSAPAVVQTPAKDVNATPSTLHWVGYRINEDVKKLNIEFVTQGRPEYEIFETVNKSNQNEIVFRFYHTKLRKKIKWDVNSSEFRSPVAYIRMKDREAEGIVDLVITHRDKVVPGFYEKNGNFILSYDIPDRYFSELDIAKVKVKEKAVSLVADQATPLAKAKTVASKLPVVGVPRYVTAFRVQPKFMPIRNFIAPKRIKGNKNGFPESFDKSPVKGRRTGEIFKRSSLFAVAQDNLEDDLENEENSVNPNANPNANSGNNFNNNSNLNNNNSNLNNTGNNSNLNNNSNNLNNNNSNLNNNNSNLNNNNSNLNNNNTNNNLNNLENELENNALENNSGLNNESNPSAFQNLENAGNAPKDSFSNSLTPAENGAQPAPGEANVQPVPTEDVEPEEAGGKQQKYSGKPIFMEFYDSPLNLVLKSFSEETGNNFVFPTDVGSMPITIQFKGVPWDEALKAILETHSLGMVRIGENVVRVDRIQNLTNYMQALEQAKQFESRRVPTKVLVFRLNNGVAKDVAARVATLLGRDIELDNRIKISEDERTNSIVIEAPAVVLAKSKSIIERLDLDTPQVEIMSRIVEVRKDDNDFTGVAWGNNVNFDPGRALGFGTLNFPNSAKSTFSVDPGVSGIATAGSGTFRLGSLNKFLDLDLFLKLEEKKGKTNVLQSNRVLVLDGRKATVTAGSSQFFRPAAGGNVIQTGAGGAGGGGGGDAAGLSEITFNLSLEVTPQVTALGNVIMNLDIASDTPGPTTGEQLAAKGTRRLTTQMVRASGDTGVIGGIYDTKRSHSVVGIPFLSDLPIVGALFRSTTVSETQTELLIMVTPTIMNASKTTDVARSTEINKPVISQKKSKKGSL